MSKRIYLIILIIVSIHLSGCWLYRPLYLIGRKTQTKFEENKGTGEAEISYGLGSPIQIFYAFGNSGDHHYIGSSSSGCIFATYHYYLSNRFSIGASFGTQTINYNWNADGGNYVFYKEKITLNTGAVEIKMLFFDNRNFQQYALLGAAATYHQEQFNSVAYMSAPAPQNGIR